MRKFNCETNYLNLLVLFFTWSLISSLWSLPSPRHQKPSTGQNKFLKTCCRGSFTQKTKNMETSQRQTYLDWLRIISIAGVLLFHSAMPYDAYDWWHIKNKETSHLFMEFVFFMHLWR